MRPWIELVTVWAPSQLTANSIENTIRPIRSRETGLLKLENPGWSEAWVCVRGVKTRASDCNEQCVIELPRRNTVFISPSRGPKNRTAGARGHYESIRQRELPTACPTLRPDAFGIFQVPGKNRDALLQ